MREVKWILVSAALGLLTAYAVWGRGGGHKAPRPADVSTLPPARKQAGASKTDAAVSSLCFEPAELTLADVAPEKNYRVAAVLHNTGRRPVRLVGVRTTCSCSKVKFGTKLLPPGGKTKLTFSYRADRGKKKGTDKVQCVVRTDEPGSPLVSLTLSAKIVYSFELQPELLNFGDVRQGETVKRTFKVRSVSGRVFALRQIARSRGDISFSWQKEPLRSEYLVTAECTPRTALGRVSETVAVVTDDRREPVVPLPVTVNVVGKMRLVVFAATLPLRSDGTAPEFTTEIRAARGTRSRRLPRVLSVKDAAGRAVEYKAEEEKDGKSIRLRLRLKGRWPAGKMVKGKLFIRTDADELPLKFEYALVGRSPRLPGFPRSRRRTLKPRETVRPRPPAGGVKKSGEAAAP